MTAATRLGPGGYPIAATRVAVHSLALSGFAGGSEAFGDVTLTAGAVTVTLSGFVGGSEAFGALALTQNAAMSGFAGGAEAFGDLAVTTGRVDVALSGFIGGSEAFGDLTLTVGATAIDPSGFASLNAFGTLSLTYDVDVALSGFAGVNEFGTLRLLQNAALSGFADDDAFGGLTLTPAAVTLQLQGFAGGSETFGSLALVPGPVTITLDALADADALGVVVVQAKKKTGQGGGTKPGGVGSAQKYATRLTMSEGGLIVALEAQASVAKAVNTRMALYADVGGLPGALLAQSAAKNSVVIGSNIYALSVPKAVPAGTSVWAALHSDGNFNWFLTAGPTSRFNADAFADGPSDPFGASTVSNNKAPVFVVYLEAVTLEVAAAGFADDDGFGSVTLVPALPQDVALAGFAEATEAFGGIEVRPASARVELSGFAGSEAFGGIEVRQAPVLTLSGFAATNAFGTLVIEKQPVPHINARLMLKNGQRRVRELSNPIGAFKRILKNQRPRARELAES